MGKHIRYEMDVRDFIEQCLDRSLTVDGVITDAPYDHLEKHRSIGTTTRLQGEWFDTLSLDELSDVMNQMLDLLTDGSHVYFWGNTKSIYDFKQMFEDLGYTYNNTLFWVKKRLGMGYSYRNCVEPILFVSKGKRRKIRDMGQRNVFQYPRPSSMPSFAKPPEIYKDILRTASRHLELWLDPFAGTDPLSHLRDNVFSLRTREKDEKTKTLKSWVVDSISVDIGFSEDAYQYPFKPFKEIDKNKELEPVKGFTLDTKLPDFLSN